MSDQIPTEDLADLYDHAPCGYLSISPEGDIVKVNATLLDWLGRSEEKLLGRSIHEVLSFGGKIAFETHLAPLLRLQGHVYEIALDLVDAAGNQIPVIANAAERRGPAGDHYFTRLTVFKAVDRRKFERDLIEARIKAEAAAKSERRAQELRDQFIAVLGHDLRNPLAAIASGLTLLQKGEGRSARDRMLVEEMGRSLARANRLIDDVLDFARGKLGAGIPLDIQPEYALRPVLEQVIEEMHAIYPDCDFQADIACNLPVQCDPDRIGQLLSNLLANAVTYGAPESAIVIEAQTTDTAFSLSVANTGEAIPENVREQLFQPFFRGQARENKQGLGLGLFIVNEIARAHAGVMELNSTAEQTRFTFRMPRQSELPAGTGDFRKNTAPRN